MVDSVMNYPYFEEHCNAIFSQLGRFETSSANRDWAPQRTAISARKPAAGHYRAFTVDRLPTDRVPLASGKHKTLDSSLSRIRKT
jgi:hypothetical protein